MNCASTDRARPCGGAAARRGYTMIEMLVALAIVSIFLSGVYMTYIQVAQTQKIAAARLDALRNGRSALQSLSDELKGLNDIGGNGLLISPDTPTLAYGDGIDNDGDGLIDEEIVNGLNDDPTTMTATVGLRDRHADLQTTPTLKERPLKVGVYDLGDADVDEDCKFGQDFIIFQVTPEAPSNIVLKVVTYAIDPAGFDGIKNVLVRQTRIERINPANPSGPHIIDTGKAPIAFNVLAFDLLFWDSNASPGAQTWLTAWDSTQKIGDKFRLPASVYIRLTMRSDSKPEDATPPGSPVQTIVLATVVDIESVIGSPLFERPVFP